MDYPALVRAARRKATAELMRHAASELDRIVSGRRALRAVRHPLGFACLPILRDGADGVCVHLFGIFGTEPAAREVPQVHCHSWDLTSTVLYGRLGNQRMDVDDDTTEDATHRVFEVLSDPSGVDNVRPTARVVRCLPGAEQTSSRGQIYALPAGEFHTTRVPDGRPTATLVLGRTLPGRVDLSLGPLSAPGHRMVRRTCDATETARIARAALRRIHEPEP
ncbi:hypothetical protein J2Z21_004707 [Streptomyces griseochromogenes]|uniref:Uncharacterized protein n=1 Tax=Streptomyces griseochromogenes TaxID=68214 RepID=A0A1B1AT92_9ACTN|nr:hypothetical protein [Streptomyces griseochromogenes]ANP49784.1 hypothetical protein AVL59_09335 [Streptomyces griseochromogenes]MBP2051730.1 hypothetical protein [Streptomyces griseochromogenes]